MAEVIGVTGGPSKSYARIPERIRRYAPLATQITQAGEEALGRQPDWVEQGLQYGVGEAYKGGLDPAQRTKAQRIIAGRYRSAVGEALGKAAGRGRFTRRAAGRLASREAGRTLAPAFGELEAEGAKLRAAGVRTGLGALTSIYGPRAAKQERQETAFGELLGGMVKRGAADELPKKSRFPAPKTGFRYG